MAISEYWRLSGDLSVVQVALLVIGEDPELWQHRIPGLSMEDRPKGYEAVISALTTDILEGRLPAKIFFQDDEWGRDSPSDWFKTTIAIGDLRSWLELKSMPLGFFQSPAPGASDYLNPDHSKYAPKLAAAVSAWNAVVGDDRLCTGKSVKKALEIWLEANAAAYGLVMPDGQLNKSGIEETAKIANWDPKGGAPKTPTKA